MAKKVKRFIKAVLLSILTLLILIIMSIGFLINFVFTPEKFTPQVLQYSKEYLDGSLDISQIELTFFSTFPVLHLQLENGTLVSNEGDTLLTLKELSVHVEVASLLTGDEIAIDQLLITEPVTYVTLDENGNSNWAIFPESEPSDTTQVSDTTSTSSEGIYTVNDLQILNASVSFIDEANLFRTKIYGMDLVGDAVYIEDRLECDLKLLLEEVSLSLNDQPIINPVSLRVLSKNVIQLEEDKIYVDTLNVEVLNNELRIESKGFIHQDTLGSMFVDFENRFFTSNIRESLDLIPLRYMDLEGFEGKGTVDLTTDIEGFYNENSFPVLDLDLKISDGEASYADFPKKIELFETEIGARVDYLNKRSSAIDLANLRVVSDGLSLNFSGDFKEILTNPQVVLKGQGGVSFTDLLQTIPIEDLDASGKVNFKVATDFYLKDLVSYNFGKIGANGALNLSNVDLSYKSDSITFNTSSSTLNFGQEQNANRLGQENARLLSFRMDFKDLNLAIEDMAEINTKRFRGNAKTSPVSDTTQISPIKVNFNLNRGAIMAADSSKVHGNNVKGKLEYRSARKDKTVPVLLTSLKGKRLRAVSGVDYASLKNFDYQFRIEKRKNRWPLKGTFKFDTLFLFTSSFPKRIIIEKTSVGVTTNTLSLNNANVRIGESTMNLTGKIMDLQKTIFDNSSLKAEMVIKSDSININQITGILDKANSTTSETNKGKKEGIKPTTTSGEDAMTTFIVPKNVDFNLRTAFKKVKYDDLIFRGMRGQLTVKDQVVRLKNFRMKTKAADLWTNVKYSATNERNATTTFDVKLTDVDVSGMLEIMSFMDTLLPMTKDFEGNLNVGVRGYAKIQDNMEVDQSTLQAVARIEGQKLVLLDGETFQYIAKTLKFKNRDRNVLDTIAVEMAIDNGRLEIFPSLVTMDRYRVAVGGIQNLDLTYNYHISVLKSPLPFKTGIDIFGKAEDYDYKITKAKYKNIFSDKKKKQDDEDRALIQRKNEIMKRIQFDD